ncbi:MAG: DNA primase large subunit PriL [Thermoplasmata archaeon]
MKLLRLANYPFLRESATYLKENGPSLDELLHDMAYERTRALGKERVLEALSEGKIKDHSLITDADTLAELLSYVTARILVSCVNDPYLTKRYALAEAEVADARLEKEDFGFVVEVAKEFDLDVKLEDGVCKIDFIHFLRNTSQMRSKQWKIANQDMQNGYVILDKNHLARVVQQALQMRIEGELPGEVNDEILKDLSGPIEEIKRVLEERKSTFKAEDFGKIRVTKLAPCIRTLLAKAQSGENLPHSGRFALTAFLHSIGMSADEIVHLFGSSPDFDESKTRYQIEHITGKISGTEYIPPECSTMKSYGICFQEDNLCKKEWMTHPLKYYRIKDKSKYKGKSKKEKIESQEKK